MTDRATLADAFLKDAGWGTALKRPLAGDASNRRYDRLTHPDFGPAVLMDAPPEKGEDVRPFTRIARLLLEQGFSAPEIYAEDTDNGFLLLEDLGDDLYARVLADQPALEPLLYEAAVDLLAELHQSPAPEDLPAYDSAMMAPLADLAVEWYAPTAGTKTALSEVLAPLLDQYAPGGSALVMRDYHAENLLWLPDRDGLARVGLLDFQDAMRGHPGYDLVSFLQDARRDVDPTLRDQMLDRYIDRTGVEGPAFRAACAVLSAQRNLRIFGVFARLCLRDSKAHYVDFLPRVWAHLMTDLSHPALAPLAKTVAKLLPEPTPEIQADLKARCASLQTR
ncbi:aminoglycoside phosphotransferase family protein [Actibacterium pelagium]|uniref:Aminoglycoside phosphotransferase n=1 Tax=Actibacterium pelagium TaxID=2029103 RepID=A0A917EK46_9RHOB|nr:phosphotransferase [Actibacterium pelagium]GGE55656.1 aminoglycoside phosphotransferase [Actibacterium pelagium]